MNDPLTVHESGDVYWLRQGSIPATQPTTWLAIIENVGLRRVPQEVFTRGLKSQRIRPHCPF